MISSSSTGFNISLMLILSDTAFVAYALVSDQMVKKWRMVAYESFGKSFIIYRDKTEEVSV